ncbi:DNA-binding transcriptional regulator, MerR family [Saccharopolyspora antimicrobica]|uniref:DNA-binding transcriptional MerR regulator n=1 Tax=Saccharopolyspora antimicrobica TaxID=455193 RepID=A0A1I5HF31_9PSEU|nr:MerR family transcriptional regulator [Saccharopolyspora antimicrobica]RKT85329.1 DNA-binding transcriptional MerR regulator [Saccharopolyspora antimicrobica]SFO46853.1 DNA-binding transcriptional regulator, MerR family [Saccharopolyspora antimicrobica]
MLIGELSRISGVDARLLRYYESQGLLEPRRGANGYREYDENSVVVVRQIRALLEAGLSTEVIRAVLPCVRGELPEFEWCVDVRAIMDRELAIAEERIAELQRSRSNLAGFLENS